MDDEDEEDSEEGEVATLWPLGILVFKPFTR